MNMVAYQATCQQAAAAAQRARSFARLAQECRTQGAPAPWALKIAREALEEANLYMGLARAELARMEDAS